MNGVARVLPPVITEAQFTQRLIEAAEWHGWLANHARPARVGNSYRTAISGHAGYPDVTLARHGVLILAELKVGRNKPTKQQLEWLAMLGPFGRLWYPHQWDSDIIPTLRGER